ncbi:MAG TPA: HAD family phosphatase [Candidatus Saccharimonadales bacterium]|nr:HAD family phosphatase [Candidatus Saccharimonadales bacterium]
MTAPSAVVFDLGKVLVDFDYEISSRKFAARSRLTPAQIRQLIDHSPLLYRFETGLLTNEEFYGEVCAQCGFSGSMEDFSAIFADIFCEIKPMIAMHAALRAKGVPVYIFSNTNDIAVEHIRAKFPFFSHFDGYTLSFKEGVMKPAPKIYEAVEHLTGHKGKALVYLDDRADNIATARERGWHALLHETPEKTIAALRQLGLPLPLNL